MALSLLLSGLLIFLAANQVQSQDYYDEIYPYSWNEAPSIFAYSQPDVSPLIINGTRATAGLIPYQAMLTIDGEFLCGGCLISRNFVLTAAHCVDRDVGNNFHVVLGVTKISEIATAPASFLVANDAITIHPYYNVQNDNNIYDVALIRLPDDAPGNNLISTIRLPRYDQRSPLFFRNKIGRISGWGYTATNGGNGVPSDDLMYADVRITPNAICNAEARRNNRNLNARRNLTFTNEHLCTRSRSGAGVCFGDSGGPLAVRDRRDNQWTLVGVISFLLGETCEDALYGYTFMSPTQRDWISRVADLPIRRRW